jgi:hypothetical protein
MTKETDEIIDEIKKGIDQEREEEAQVNNSTEEEEAEAEEVEAEEIEDDFEDFKKHTSEHKFTEASKEGEIVKPKINENDEFLISMFSGMFFSLCDGLHGFVFNFFSKHKLDSEAIELTEPQKKGLEVYFKTERVVKFLNKLSPELIGIVHMEWLYFQNMKVYNKKQDELIAEQNKNRKTIVENPPVKKKKKKKKKPVVKKNEG